jgi:hypothetical protein
MAEWAILILVFAVVGGAWGLSRFYFETWQIVGIWVGAGLIITIGLIVYISTKVDSSTQPWIDRYQIEP